MASGRLFKRSGTKFRFRGLPEDPKIIITDPFYEEKGGMTTTTRHDNSETPEPSQPPSSSHSGMKYLVRTSPHFDLMVAIHRHRVTLGKIRENIKNGPMGPGPNGRNLAEICRFSPQGDPSLKLLNCAERQQA